ncbi:fatty-acid--CoA ligase [Arthrobacter alpinus]|uniref:Fatty-acid--CoA ligase n=1 Tax=Arthrobacter alpinus TaxID=656366 RepID=A0A0S2LXJ1_9MICC|nr:long-chain fatty acid--CoA ligase [Arthrobacter alpinus]ALO66249.1 fatty-acid--CoA ligase [Arthrobacter alpinus]
MYLTQGLHRSLQADPQAIATIFKDRVRSYAEHADRIAKFAGALQTLGVHSGDRVAMVSLNSDRYAEYLLAVPWAGAAVVPVNTRWTPAEIAYSMNDSDTRVLLVDDAFVDMVPILQDLAPGLTTLIHCGDGPTPEGMLSYEALVAESKPVEDAYRSGDDLAGVLYTGGTTGFPKGVMLSHTNFVTSGLGTVASGELLKAGDVLLHAAPMFHAADLAIWSGMTIMGGTHVMVPAFEPISVFKAIDEHKPTAMLLVPTMIQILADHPDAGNYDLSSLTRMLYGGSSISEGVLKRAMARFPGLRMTQAYGQTEASPVITLLLPDDHHGDALRSGGRAAPHSQVAILDFDGKEVPTGVVGEVCTKGANVMLGYWNNPDQSAQALRGGWLHTGDLGYVDAQGFVYVVDRLKDMIITGGENVYCAEVENALSKHPAVASSAVIGVPDEKYGERVHAVVVLVPGRKASAEELAAHCKEHIAGYKVPRSFEFPEALPMSGAGKILKRELRESYTAAQEKG